MDRDALDRTLIAGIEREAAAGAVAAVLDTSGVQWMGAAGERSLGGGVAMTTDTIFALHSMTKAIVSIAALQLVERGLVSLDEPASTWCPWLDEVAVLDQSGSAGAELRPPASPITLHHLLTHTSGFAYQIWDQQLARWMEQTNHPSSLLERDALKTPIVFDPGTSWQYGIGLDWAGLMIEAVVGRSLGAHVHDEILEPLGMLDTAFHPTEEQNSRRAGRHQRHLDGTLRTLAGDPPINSEFDTGGGGLFGTVPDFVRFLAMLLGGGTLDGVRILDEANLRRWGFTNRIGDLRVQQLVSQQPLLSRDAEFFPGDPKGHSLVGQVNLADAETGRRAGTLAWAGMANCYFWVDPVSGRAGVYASRMFPFADKGSLGLALELERIAYATGGR